MESWKDKTIWITGASSGIGEALAITCSKEGARIILSARREDELLRVKAKCAYPDKVSIQVLDLEQAATFPEIVNEIYQKHKTIDILINNGGLSQRAEAITTAMEVERRIMEVNYFGTIALTKLVLQHMVKNKSGHIVIMSSIAGKFGFYLRSAYSASKHALHGYFESLRLENEKEGIKVSIVCPGKINTDISLNALNNDGKKNDKMDHNQETGMSADECAKQIIKGIKKNKEEIFVGGKEIKAVFLKRFFPKLFGKIIRRQPAT